MTRCWPINGKFSSSQAEAYEAVLDVQLDLIKFCNERPPLDILFQRMCRQLGKNLQQIGFGKAGSSCAERSQVKPSSNINDWANKATMIDVYPRWRTRCVLITSPIIWESMSMIPERSTEI